MRLGTLAMLAAALSIVSSSANAQARGQVTPEAAQNKAMIERGAHVYRSSCAMCHRDPKRFAKRFQGANPRVRGEPLEEFIAGHHPPQPTPRRDLIAYLKSL